MRELALGTIAIVLGLAIGLDVTYEHSHKYQVCLSDLGSLQCSSGFPKDVAYKVLWQAQHAANSPAGRLYWVQPEAAKAAK